MSKGAIFTNVINPIPAIHAPQLNLSAFFHSNITPVEKPPNKKHSLPTGSFPGGNFIDINKNESEESRFAPRPLSSQQYSDFFFCIPNPNQSPVVMKSPSNISPKVISNSQFGRLLENKPGSPGMRRAVFDPKLRQAEVQLPYSQKSEQHQNPVIRLNVDPCSFQPNLNSINEPLQRYSLTPKDKLLPSQNIATFQQRMSVPITGTKCDLIKVSLGRDAMQLNGSIISSSNFEQERNRPIQPMTFVNVCQSGVQTTINTSSHNDPQANADVRNSQAAFSQQYTRSVNQSPALQKSSFHLVNNSNIVYSNSPVQTQPSFQSTKGPSQLVQNSFLNEKKTSITQDQQTQPNNGDQQQVKSLFGGILAAKDSNIQSFEAKLNHLKSKISSFALGKDKSPKENNAKRSPRINDRLFKLN